MTGESNIMRSLNHTLDHTCIAERDLKPNGAILQMSRCLPDAVCHFLQRHPLITEGSLRMV